MNITKQTIMGMELEVWTHESCTASFGVGEFGSDEPWATLYDIRSLVEGKGHATQLLKAAKRYYEAKGMAFGGSVALNERMRSIYKRLGITEYQD
jgi:hypothetical protein